jgi:hypothetical protein
LGVIFLKNIINLQKISVHGFLDLLFGRPLPSKQLVLVGRLDPVLPISSMRARRVAHFSLVISVLDRFCAPLGRALREGNNALA